MYAIRIRRVAHYVLALVLSIWVGFAFGQEPRSGLLTPLAVQAGTEQPLQAELGQVKVPENRRKAGGRSIGAAFIRVRSAADEPVDPVFILPGGPGVSIYDMLDPGILPMVTGFASFADVVLVEQRGNIAGTPHLRCDSFSIGTAQLAGIAHDMVSCRDAWANVGIDLNSYNVIEAAGDVEDIRRFLGYDKISLAGVSFGSHWALVTMREYPDSIARAYLGGVEGLDHTYDMPTEVLAAIERVAAHAEADARLSALIPEQGLLVAVQEVIDRLEVQPVQVDTADGAPMEITADDVRSAVRWGMADRDGVIAWPSRMLQIIAGDFSGVAANKIASSQWPITPAFFYGLDCASGITDVRANTIKADPAIATLGHINADYFDECPVWNVADLGDDFRASYESDIPVLIVQGNWDSSTPIENLREVTPMFTDAKVVVANRGTHLASLYALADPAIVPHIAGFLMGGDTSTIPSSFDAWTPEYTVPGELDD